MWFEFGFESLKSISVLILSVYMLMFGSSKHNRESYPKKFFWTQEKETRNKFNPGLSANRPSNNWALYSKYSFKGLREVMISQKPSLRNYSIGQANQKEHDEKRLLVKNKLAIANCCWDISHILLWWLHTNSSKTGMVLTLTIQVNSRRIYSEPILLIAHHQFAPDQQAEFPPMDSFHRALS